MIRQNLTFKALRKANTIRLPLFKNSKGETAHSKPDGSDWTLSEWMCALVGELGEAANLVKKIRRGDLSLTDEAVKSSLGDELADIVTYADIALFQMGVSATEYWRTFGELRDNSSSYEVDYSLGGWMNCAFAGFGRAAESIHVSARAEVAFVPGYGVSGGFRQGLAAIDRIADKIDIDLGLSTVGKFNAVSRRVNADVFINASNEVVNAKGQLL